MNTELRAHVDRYVNLLEEAEANRADQKELTTEIKDDGFDPSTVKKLAALVISDKKARKKKAENEQMALYIREAGLQLDLGYETTVAEIVAGEIKPSIGGSTPPQPAGNDAPRSSSAAASPPPVETPADVAVRAAGAEAAETDRALVKRALAARSIDELVTVLADDAGPLPHFLDRRQGART